MKDLTLQINLSAGDLGYAKMTVPVLVNAHRLHAAEKLAIVDCCRPQKTQVVDPDRRFPEPEFTRRVAQICNMAEELKVAGYFDRIVYLYPNDALRDQVSRKYLRGIIRETHDAGGVTLFGYLAAWEIPTTRYVLHYDADMLLYQECGFDWAVEAKRLMQKDKRVVSASPRLCPPLKTEQAIQKVKVYSRKNKGRNCIPSEGGWLNDWFSNRCFLIDRDRLRDCLPLLKGRFLWETILRKFLNRGYPPSSEMMLFHRLCDVGGWRLVLNTEQAWLLHPLGPDKLRRYLELLPEILHAISEKHFPEEQRGFENINLNAWENFLNNGSVQSTQKVEKAHHEAL